MKNTINKNKLLTIGILPLLWIVYFSFEIVTGRVNDLYTLILNLSLTLIFGLIGSFIYYISNHYVNGFSNSKLFIIFTILMLLDQGSKLIINFLFFDKYFELIPRFLSFNPIINTQGSWLNARFGLGVSFSLLILINALSLILFFELFRYNRHKGNKDFWSDMCFLFIFSGALCSLIDKVFYGGSLDFIGISDLFIADIKDIYINLSILFFIVGIYINGFFNEDDSSLKDDLNSIRKFLSFVKKDLLRLIKKEAISK